MQILHSIPDITCLNYRPTYELVLTDCPHTATPRMTIQIVTNKPKGSHPGIRWELIPNPPTSHQLYRSRVSLFKICTKVPVTMGKPCPHAQITKFTTHLSPLLFSSNSPQALHGPSNGNPLICFCFTRKDTSDPFIHYNMT